MANKNISFEEAINDLENSVSVLENGDLTLENSLKEFEKAIKLIEICTNKLDNARQKVKILVEQSDGSISDMDFNSNENET